MCLKIEMCISCIFTKYLRNLYSCTKFTKYNVDYSVYNVQSIYNVRFHSKPSFPSFMSVGYDFGYGLYIISPLCSVVRSSQVVRADIRLFAAPSRTVSLEICHDLFTFQHPLTSLTSSSCRIHFVQTKECPETVPVLGR